MIGFIGAQAASRGLASVLVDARSDVTPVLLVSSALLLVVALGACLPAALRASRIDPMSALRND